MFMESIWHIVNETFKRLYLKYLSEKPDSPVSYGTFLKLKPFYVRSVTTKYVEICCCKKHLHVRWGVSALLQLCKQQRFEPSFTDYYSLFNAISSSCAKDNHKTTVNWYCVKDKKDPLFPCFREIEWIKQKLIEKCDPNKTVGMQLFIKVKATIKKRKEVTKLTATTANDQLLSK